MASIAFLVSIGYGLQDLVISRVARLDEMQQAEIYSPPASNTKINDESIAKIANVQNVEKVLPLITLVAKVNYNNSISDMAVYAVTSDYLEQSAIKPVKGKIFDNDLTSFNLTEEDENKEEVAGASSSRQGGEQGGEISASQNNNLNEGLTNIEVGKRITEAEISIFPETWVRVREKPSLDSKILGYTKRPEGKQTGYEVWGNSYPDNINGTIQAADGKVYGKWVESKVFLWEEKNNGYIQVIDEQGSQVQKTGFMAEVNLGLQRYTLERQPEVLAEADTRAVTDSTETQTDSQITTGTGQAAAEDATTYEDLKFDGTDWILIEEGNKTEQIERVQVSEKATREAVANTAMLDVLGLTESEAIGKEIEVSFIVTASLLEPGAAKIESVPTKYKIIGVVPQKDAPYFYVPFIDIRSLGVMNYSQAKIIVQDQQSLTDVRKKIEAMGFETTSVVDTVEQINTLFATLRKMLALAGTVALSVAALGMFNTLTVSLLERTREIGLMKAMGMKSFEVKELFLTESMIMGVFGGIIGVSLGALAGELLGFIISIFSISKGLGYIDVASMPVGFTLFVLSLSLIVGTLTGIYPARRATNISALNAMRYE